jgi:hypothetical protein
MVGKTTVILLCIRMRVLLCQGLNMTTLYDQRASSTSFLSTHGIEPELETNRPLLLVKLTCYRLLTTAIIVTFGTVKAMASLKGKAVTATTMDWVMGVVLGTMCVDPPAFS